jgi:hypothetical protein
MSARNHMFIALALTISTTACTLAEEQLDESEVASAARVVKSSPTPAPAPTGPTCELATTDSDPMNCGTCGNVCGSGLCYGGVCADSTGGHVFVIGHGYGTSNGALDKMLGNAVFLNERQPVRVLAYAGTAPAALITGTDAAIDRMATLRGRTWAKTQVTSSSDVALNLPNADVFLVYAQPDASSEYLYSLGNEWGFRLDNFTRRGGVIVVLDTPSANAGTAEVLVASGLMTLTNRAPAGALAYVHDAADVGAARVPLMFATTSAVSWAPSIHSTIAATDTGNAIAVHRAIY